MSYFKSKTDAVAFVNEKLESSKPGSPLTMIIGRDKSGDYYAHTATVESSDVTDSIQVMTYSD